jgi:AcrR family transcriptional regulator
MTDARIRKTRAALAQAMLALAREKAFAEITISEIAERAGIGYATFFRHYRDKDALLVDVADGLMNDLLALMAPALIQEDTLAASVALCRFVETHRAICTALLAGGAGEDIRHHLVHRAEASARSLGLPQPGGLPQDLLIRHAVSATLGLLAWWLDHPGSLGPAAMGAAIDRLVMKPVRAR